MLAVDDLMLKSPVRLSCAKRDSSIRCCCFEKSRSLFSFDEVLIPLSSRCNISKSSYKNCSCGSSTSALVDRRLQDSRLSCVELSALFIGCSCLNKSSRPSHDFVRSTVVDPSSSSLADNAVFLGKPFLPLAFDSSLDLCSIFCINVIISFCALFTDFTTDETSRSSVEGIIFPSIISHLQVPISSLNISLNAQSSSVPTLARVTSLCSTVQLNIQY
mmetsp:Transcript_30608/g.46291  ORF Transcript_30608/g.46291 Transcript_30608/m.46291 type:complete len:217 (-) Transcript_30608:20-670(-)